MERFYHQLSTRTHLLIKKLPYMNPLSIPRSISPQHGSDWVVSFFINDHLKVFLANCFVRRSLTECLKSNCICFKTFRDVLLTYYLPVTYLFITISGLQTSCSVIFESFSTTLRLAIHSTLFSSTLRMDPCSLAEIICIN